jgi:predicted amidophosphoribosyltransferase
VPYSLSRSSDSTFNLSSEISRKVDTMMKFLSVWRAMACVGLYLAMADAALATSPQAQWLHWQQVAGQAGQASRGQVFFTQKHGGEWSCASCHGQPPTQPSRHASTGKTIAPLAPAFHAERFTDSAKVDKWFKRNCKDVLSRECTAFEKADVMAYLIGLK